MLHRRWFHICVFCVGLALLLPRSAGAAPLVELGSVWRYLDDGSNQSNAWRTANFEDDGWDSGPAQLGYGDGDEATEVGWGPDSAHKYITTYFRQVFDIPDPRAYSNLVLRLLRDDGAVVYINNVEVFRSNMPGGGISYLTLAAAGVSGSAEDAFSTTNVSPSVLVAGDNLIAVEIHQEDDNSSDISFDLELTDGRNDSPTVKILSPASNALLPAPGDVTIDVAVIDPNGTVTNVQFFAGNMLLGQLTGPPFAFTWTNVAAGAHVISALARDNDGLLGVSSAVKFTVSSGTTSNLTLIAAGSNWKYLDNGTDQGIAWSGRAFDDSSWTNGPAQLGYGDGDEARVIGYGGNSANKYITTYFRKSFVLADPGLIADLVLQLLVDDGAVVFVNGVEAFRVNLPATSITYTTPASASWENNSVRAILNRSLLVAGNNVIAVEVHQQDIDSSDLSFDLELFGSDLPSVLRGPWLQSVSWTGLIIKWRTDALVSSGVRFGTNPADLPGFVGNPGLTNEHRVVLTGLTPGTRYFYTIGTTTIPLLGDATYHFTTSPRPGTRQRTRVWALGDSGTANVSQFNVRNAFYRQLGTNELDLLLLLGDNAYNAGRDSEYQRALFDCYPTMLRNTPLWPTLGNHETDQSSSPSSTIPYYQVFSLLRSAEVGGTASGTENYYSFDHANIHFVCLDSMTSGRSSSGTMATWLRNDLASTTQAWVIAFWHPPPYTKGSHNSDTESNLIAMRQNFLPILEAHGVDLVLCGHSHAYERSHLLDGHYGTSGTLHATNLLDTTGGRAAGPYVKPLYLTARHGTMYVVTGSAGKTGGGGLDHPAMFRSLNRLGSLYFEVSGDRLDARFIRDTGDIQDSFTILKGGTPYQLVRSGGASLITWTSVLGQTYQVDYKDDLSVPNWTPFRAAIMGDGLPITVTDDATGAQRYYRIGAR